MVARIGALCRDSEGRIKGEKLCSQKTCYVSGMQWQKVVLYSTPDSRSAGKISLLAVGESALSVALFWWLAVTFDIYLHLWLAILAAPLLLCRSPTSIGLGADLFMRFWQPENGPHKRISLAPVVLLAAFGAGLAVWVLADNWLATSTGAITFWRALATGLVAANMGMAVAVAVWGHWALTEGKAAAMVVAGGATLAAVFLAVSLAVFSVAAPGQAAGQAFRDMAPAGGAVAVLLLALTIAGLAIEKENVGRVLRGIGVVAVFVTFGFSIASGTVTGGTVDIILGGIWLAMWALGAIAAVAGLMGTRGLALVASGAGVGIFMGACAARCIARCIATIQQPAAGLQAFPSNWLCFILQTDSLQRPEVVPGLPKGHMLRSENRDEFWDSVSHLEEWQNILAVGILLEFPSFLYRISLKSTAWLFLPLLYFAVFPIKSRDG